MIKIIFSVLFVVFMVIIVFAAYVFGQSNGIKKGETEAMEIQRKLYKSKVQAMIVFIDVKDYNRLQKFLKRELEFCK